MKKLKVLQKNQNKRNEKVKEKEEMKRSHLWVLSVVGLGPGGTMRGSELRSVGFVWIGPGPDGKSV